MRSHIRERFKPVAEIARRSSSAALLSSNLLFQEALHAAPHYITTDRIGSQVRALCDFWGRPDWTASFDERFRLLFAEEWERLVCETELEAPSQPATQIPPAHGDARSHTQPSKSWDADEEKSAAEQHRREVICEAARLGLEGSEYCKYLDRETIPTSLRLRKKGCPATYTAAYKNPKWRKSIQDEKTRIVNGSTKSSRESSKKTTVH